MFFIKGESEIRTHGTGKVLLISSQMQSTTLPSLQKRAFLKILFLFIYFFYFYESYEATPVNLIDAGFGFFPIEKSRFPTATRPLFTFSGKTPSFGCKN